MILSRRTTYSSAGDSELNLAPGSTHQLAELGADTLEKSQTVVLGESVEEVLDGVGLVLATGVLLELSDDGGLVLGGEGRCLHDVGELWVLDIDLREGAEGLGHSLERLRLHGSSVLWEVNVSIETCIMGQQADGQLQWSSTPSWAQCYRDELTYQSTGISAIEAEEGDRRLGVGAGGRCCVRADCRLSGSSARNCHACSGGVRSPNKCP